MQCWWQLLLTGALEANAPSTCDAYDVVSALCLSIMVHRVTQTVNKQHLSTHSISLRDTAGDGATGFFQLDKYCKK